MALNIVFWKKKYNALFYSLLEYIHQLSMLPHVKFWNFNFTWIKINPNIIYAPQCLKQNFSVYYLSEKVYNALFYSVLENIHQLSMLSHVKYRNSYFTWIEKNLNIIEAPQCKKQNCSEYNLTERIYNTLFYFVLDYIHQLNMLSNVKYRNSNLHESRKI